MKMDPLTPCGTPDQLHAWARYWLGLDVPRTAVCGGHDAPFEYLRRAYFEPAGDAVVWAPRGGGKTRLAAAATLLDLLHKPGTGVRVLGGSLEQSMKLWEYLLPDLRRLGGRLLAGPGAGDGPAGEPAQRRVGGRAHAEPAGGPRAAGAEVAVRRGRAVRPGGVGGGAAHHPQRPGGGGGGRGMQHLPRRRRG